MRTPSHPYSRLDLAPPSADQDLQRDATPAAKHKHRSGERIGGQFLSAQYDGQGFWLAQKRLSKGRFAWWPARTGATQKLEANEAQMLLAAAPANPNAHLSFKPLIWRRVSPAATAG